MEDDEYFADLLSLRNMPTTYEYVPSWNDDRVTMFLKEINMHIVKTLDTRASLSYTVEQNNIGKYVAKVVVTKKDIIKRVDIPVDIINNPSVKADLPLNFAKRLVAVITKQEIENMNANKVKQPVVQKEIVKQEPITTIQEVVVNVVEEGKQEVSEEETYIKELKEEKIKQDTLKKLTKEAKKQKEKAKKDKE